MICQNDLRFLSEPTQYNVTNRSHYLLSALRNQSSTLINTPQSLSNSLLFTQDSTQVLTACQPRGMLDYWKTRLSYKIDFILMVTLNFKYEVAQEFRCYWFCGTFNTLQVALVWDVLLIDVTGSFKAHTEWPTLMLRIWNVRYSIMKLNTIYVMCWISRKRRNSTVFNLV